MECTDDGEEKGCCDVHWKEYTLIIHRSHLFLRATLETTQLYYMTGYLLPTSVVVAGPPTIRDSLFWYIAGRTRGIFSLTQAISVRQNRHSPVF